MRFSASRIRMWSNCPLQAKFRYEDHLPGRQNAKASFGTVIHHVLEHYNHSKDHQASKDMFLDLWNNPAKLGVEPDYWPKFTSFGGLKQRGLDILDQHHQATRWDKREVIATEHPFLVPFGDHELTGFVDLIEIRKTGKGASILAIVDYKTSSKAPSKSDLALDVQFTSYIYAVNQPRFWSGWPDVPEYADDFPPIAANSKWLWETVKPLPQRAIWYHLWNASEKDAGGRDQKDFERLYEVMCQIDKAQKAGIYVPKIGEACLWCDYTEPCGVTIPTPEERLAEPNVWI